MTTLIVTIAGMVALLLLKGFFSGSEIALVSADKIKMMHEAKHGNKGAGLVLRLFREPEKLLATTLVGTNLATVGLTTLGTLAMIRFFGSSGELIAMVIFVPLLLIFGEIVPKSVMQQKADTITPIIIYPLKWSTTLFSPITFVFSRIARVFARLMGANSTDSGLSIDREQLRAMVDMSQRTEGARDLEHGRLARVLRFAETTVAQVMVPVSELPSIASDTPTADAIALMLERRYRRIVVYDHTVSTVIGVFKATPWQMMDKSFAETKLSEHTTEPLFFNQHQTIDEVMPLLWKDKEAELGIVVDEFGLAIGVISFEDIVEEVVGDIAVDDATIGEPAQHRIGRRHQYEVLEDDTILLDSRMSLPEASEILGVKLPAGDYHTLGGLVLTRFRHIPVVGESVELSGYRMVVQKANRRGIDMLRIESLAR